MRHPLVLFALSLLESCTFLYGQGGHASLPTGEQGAVESLIKSHDAWGPKTSTPNTELRIVPNRVGGIDQFRLIATGLPKNSVYSLLIWPITQKSASEALKGVTVDATGLAICAGTPGTCGSPDKLNDPIDIAVQPVPGEPVRLGLISDDGATKVFAKVVAIPLRGDDRGCSVEAVVLAPGAELVLVVGSGFPANNDATMDSVSGDERQGGKVKIDSDGRYIGAILPYKKGTSKGVTKVTLKASQCTPSVEFSWGRPK